MTTLHMLSDAGPVGVIAATLDGPRITYDETWPGRPDAFAISLTMPLTQAAWSADVATPWLMNLLPEGQPLSALARALGLAREDVFALIAASGRDLAGALTFEAAAGQASYTAIPSADALERIINELPARPFLVGEEGVAMSLAGAQDKLPVGLVDESLAIPVNGAPSTHILKPDNPRLPGSVHNEALCMVLARRCGLPAAPVTTGIAGKRTYLLVTRYDRAERDGRVERIHQEDFCQALGRRPIEKYERNGTGVRGPGLADMFALVRRHMTARDITRLLDAVIFNIAIGNVDSHAKNYSILLHPGRAELAPLYDLMSGLAWSNITANHAQEVGGQRTGRHILARHWRRMAEEAGLSGSATVRRVRALTDRILAELPAAAQEVAAMPAGAGGLLDVFSEAIAARTRTVGLNAQRQDAVDDDAAAADAPADEDTADMAASSRYDP